MNHQSSFWSRTYLAQSRSIRLNFYFGETKLSEFNDVVDEVGRELAVLGLALSRETTFLTTNRAGMFLSCWFPCHIGEPSVQTLFQKLEEQKWKMAAD